MRKLGQIIAMVLVLSVASAVNADATDEPKKLYADGIAALNRGDFDIACPLLQKSYRLSPYPGTLFQWARCDDLAKRISSASLRYQLYLDAVNHLPGDKQRSHADRAKHAEMRLSILRGENATLRITLPATAPEGLIVKQDGVALPSAAFGMAIPVDLGTHEITVRRPDGVTRIEKWEITERKPYEREVEIPLPPPPPPPPLFKSATNGILVPPPKSNRLRTAGMVALGIGGAGFVTWGITGGWGLALNSIITERCPNERCDPIGWDAYTKAPKMLNIATVGLGVGVGAAAAGAVMLLVNRKRESTNSAKPVAHVVPMDMGLAGVGLGVRGVF